MILYNVNSRPIITIYPHRSLGHNTHLGQNILYPHKLTRKMSNSPISDYAFDLETTVCFLLFYDTRFLLIKTEYPVVNLLLIG